MIIYTYVSQRPIKKHLNNPGEKEHMYHVERLYHTRWQNISQWIRQEQEKQTKQSRTRVQSTSDGHHILFTFIVHTPQERYNLQEEEEEEIEAWFCLIFSAKCSVLTLQFRIFLHNTHIPKRSPVPQPQSQDLKTTCLCLTRPFKEYSISMGRFVFPPMPLTWVFWF
jgi:hypothetical protein